MADQLDDILAEMQARLATGDPSSSPVQTPPVPATADAPESPTGGGYYSPSGTLKLTVTPDGSYRPLPPEAQAGEVPPAGAAPTGTPEGQVGGSLEDAQGASAPIGQSDLDKALAEMDARMKSAPAVPVENQGVVKNYLAGFNGNLADLVTLPNDLLQEKLVTPLNTLLNRNYVPPERLASVLRRGLNSLGIATEPNKDSLAGKIGANTIPALGQLAALIAAGPTLAALPAGGALQTLGKTIGEGLVKHPYLAAFTDVAGATPGATIGEDKYGPLGGLVGGMAGGMISGPITAAGKTARWAAKPVTSLAKNALTRQAELFQGKNAGVRTPTGPAPVRTPTDAIRDDLANPLQARTFAEQQLDGAKLQIENEVMKAINAIPRGEGDPRKYQVAVRDLLNKAEDASDRIVGEYWKRVPSKAPVLGEDVLKDLRRMSVDLRDTPYSTPVEYMDKLKKLFTPNKVPSKEDPTVMVDDPKWKPPNIARLRDLRGEIYRARRTERGMSVSGREPNERLIGNYNRLEHIIDTTISSEYPSMIELKQARAASIKHNDLFTRSTLFDLLSKNSRGSSKIHPDQTVDELLKRYPGLEDMLTMTKSLNTAKRVPGQNNAYPHALTPNERMDLKTLIEQTENSIRSSFRATAEQMDNDPKVVARYIQNFEPQVRPLGRVSAELSKAGDRLEALVQERNTLEKSALARFSQKDPQKAVQAIFNAPDPSGEARALVRDIRSSHEAMEGLQAGIIDELLTRTRLDPARMADMLSDPKISRMLKQVLSPDKLDRLTRVADIATRIQRGDIQSTAQKFGPKTLIIARILGAHAFSGISRFFGGGGSIQTAAIGAQYAKQSVLKAIRGNDPKALMLNAIRDPMWERLLLSREPTSTKEAHDILATMRKAIRVMEGARQMGQSLVSRDKDKGK